jgi:hypothetical protein
LRVNGATNISTAIFRPATDETTQIVLSTEYALAAGDYVELVVYHTKGSNLNIDAGSHLWMSRRGA